MALVKNDINNSIRTNMNLTGKRSAELVEALIEILKRTLESGEDVMVSGFGKFCVKEKAEWKGRNPATGEDMMRPARRLVKFKCSAKLRDRMNTGS
jgi:integration host factor subunit alpha